MRIRSIVAALLAVTLAGPALAHDYRVGDLRIEHPWSRATPPGTPMGVGYLKVVNAGDTPDRLLGASSPAAGRVQIHRTVEKDGTTTMVHQADGVAVPANGSVRFAPGSYHLMLMGLESPLEADARVPVTLRFERAGVVEIELEVRPLAGGTQ